MCTRHKKQLTVLPPVGWFWQRTHHQLSFWSGKPRRTAESFPQEPRHYRGHRSFTDCPGGGVGRSAGPGLCGIRHRTDGDDEVGLPAVCAVLPDQRTQCVWIGIFYSAEQWSCFRSNLLSADVGIPDALGFAAAPGAGCGRHMAGHSGGGAAGTGSDGRLSPGRPKTVSLRMTVKENSPAEYFRRGVLFCSFCRFYRSTRGTLLAVGDELLCQYVEHGANRNSHQDAQNAADITAHNNRHQN